MELILECWNKHFAKRVPSLCITHPTCYWNLRQGCNWGSSYVIDSRSTHPRQFHCRSTCCHRRGFDYCRSYCRRRNQPSSLCGFCYPLPGRETSLCLLAVCTLVHFLMKFNKIRPSDSEFCFALCSARWGVGTHEVGSDMRKETVRCGLCTLHCVIWMVKWRDMWHTWHNWEDDMRTEFKDIRWEIMNWINLAQDRDRWRAFLRATLNLRLPWSTGNGLNSWGTSRLSRMTLLPGVS